MKSKEELITTIFVIDKQLEENRKVLEPYAGKEIETDSSIGRLLKVTRMLLMARIEYGNKLANSYGISII